MNDPHDPEQISLYLDDELPPGERAVLEAHVATCERCRSTRDAFLRLRALLRAEADPDAPRDHLAQRRALREILRGRPRPAPLWRRRIPVPAPAFAALLALTVLFGAAALHRNDPRGSDPPPRVASSQGSAPRATKTFDPARFDGGNRLVSYVERHPAGAPPAGSAP